MKPSDSSRKNWTAQKTITRRSPQKSRDAAAGIRGHWIVMAANAGMPRAGSWLSCRMPSRRCSAIKPIARKADKFGQSSPEVDLGERVVQRDEPDSRLRCPPSAPLRRGAAETVPLRPRIG